ncbi:MAG: S8 family serine peptidase [Propionibacteriaceae bacterium]
MSEADLPAWSEAFAGDRLIGVRPLRLPTPLTRSDAWGPGTGAGVKVAVIDSGIDGSHPLVGGVAGGVVVEPDPDARDGIAFLEGAHEDLYGHGTACAAIIRSLAPECELYSVRVLGTSLRGRSGIFAAGLRWAIEHGMNVVNLSLSTRSRIHIELFYELVDQAAFANVMLVSAVNNVPAPSYPSQFAGVFSVAAYPGRDPEHFVVNPHPPVEFGAPGVDLEVAWLDGGFIVGTGNSFAAPHIAGHVARIVGHHPGVTPAEVKTVLRALADNSEPVVG